MKTYLITLLILIVFTNGGQTQTQNKNISVQTGSFVCKINEYIIFSENINTDGENPLFNLKALSIRSKKSILIDHNLASSSCVGLSDSTIIYTNGNSIICWKSIHRGRDIYLSSELDHDIIGLGIDQGRNNILVVQVNYKKYEMLLKIISTKTKTTTFQQKIKLNEAEMEGITPSISTIDNYFIFLIQNKLYSIDSSTPVLKLISSSCDAFALNNKGLIYYRFISDENTEGYYFQLPSRQLSKIDNSLNDKIYNCKSSFMVTSHQDKSFLPYYIICGVPYVYSDYHWEIPKNVTIYRDHQVQVEFPITNNKVNESIFTYMLLK